MRIGLVLTGGVDRSGRERVVPALLWLIERLAVRHDVHIFVLHHEPEPCTYSLLGATVHDLGRSAEPRGLRRWGMRTRLARAVQRAGRFDVLHAYMGMPAGFVTTGVARALRIPAIVTFDSGELVSIPDIDYGLQRRWIDRHAIGATIQRATRITVGTQYMKQQPALRNVQASVIPMGVDTRLFAPGARVPGPPWRLIRVASLNRVKDYPTLLYTLKRVIERVPDVFLDVVGEDTLRGKMQALTQALGLERHVTYHGFQPTDRLAALYARAHLHVVSSLHEAAGVVTLEASCSGLATIGTRVGHVADWAPDRAIAVATRAPELLAGGVLELLRDPARREQIAAKARAWTLAHDADWTERELERIYESVGPAIV
jgi:glycosyltransferase involved in cell wall biosynthesis